MPKNVLRYSRERAHQATVKRAFDDWRAKLKPPLPYRCDNEECQFYTEPLFWNGKPLRLNLDHINGNNSENSPWNLRYLCPNCDSQLPTRGGANRGRVEKSVDSYALVSKDGTRAHQVTLTAQIATKVSWVLSTTRTSGLSKVLRMIKAGLG